MQQKRSRSKQLAVAGNHIEPSFETVSQAASTAALFKMSVQVLCLTQDQLRQWRRYIATLPAEDFDMQVHDLNRATLTEWQSTVEDKPSDMTVLAGFHAARHRREISTEYANSLIDAVAGGLVVMA